jgi:hypothetical protein
VVSGVAVWGGRWGFLGFGETGDVGLVEEGGEKKRGVERE